MSSHGFPGFRRAGRTRRHPRARWQGRTPEGHSHGRETLLGRRPSAAKTAVFQVRLWVGRGTERHSVHRRPALAGARVCHRRAARAGPPLDGSTEQRRAPALHNGSARRGRGCVSLRVTPCHAGRGGGGGGCHPGKVTHATPFLMTGAELAGRGGTGQRRRRHRPRPRSAPPGPAPPRPRNAEGWAESSFSFSCKAAGAGGEGWGGGGGGRTLLC